MALGVSIVSEFNSKGIDKAIRDFKRLDGFANKSAFGLQTMDRAVTNGVKKVAKFAAVAGGIGIALGAKLALAGEKTATANARILQINKSMGLFGAATEQVSERLTNLASKTALNIGLDQNIIKETQAKLLTFKNLAQTADVVGGAFDRATMAAVDLAAAGFGEATSNATQLGKALQDPVKGLTALGRAGVTFTAQEKEKIKTLVNSGKMLEAQNTLLAAVESQVKGTALATANTSDKLREAFNQLLADIGVRLLPAFDKLANYITTKVLPLFKQFSDTVGEKGLGAGLKFLGDKALEALGKLSGFGAVVYGIAAAVVALKVATITYTVAQAAANIAAVAFGVAWNATGIGLIVTGIALAVVALVALALKFKGFREYLVTVWNGIVTVVQVAINKMLGYVEFFVNKAIFVINLLTKAWSALPFTDAIAPLNKVNLALDVTAAKIDKVNKAAATGVLGGRGSAVGRLATDVDATMRTATTTIGGGGVGGGGGASAATAMDKMKLKLKEYTDTLLKAVGFQKDLKDAISGTTKANKDLEKATAKLTTAQANLNMVSAGFGAGSQQASDAQAQFDQSVRDQTRAAFDLETANFAITNAQRELNEARSTGTAQEIREAEINLAEAVMNATETQIRLREATQNVADAQANLNGVISGFPAESDRYKTAAQELAEAQDEMTAATDKVNDAKTRELETTNKLIAANRELAKRQVGITKKQAKAVARGMKNAGVTVTPEMFEMLGITPFAKGGIVTSPVNALIGEAGAEAVIPLDRLDSMVGGQVVNITVNAGMGSDGTRIGQLIVNELQAYQRRVGALPLKVS